MDEQLRNILLDLFDSEDATGCSNDLTVVSAPLIHQLQEIVRVRTVSKLSARNSHKHHWHVERSLDGLTHLTLTQSTTALIASALEAINPDSERQTRRARELALALQHLSE